MRFPILFLTSALMLTSLSAATQVPYGNKLAARRNLRARQFAVHPVLYARMDTGPVVHTPPATGGGSHPPAGHQEKGVTEVHPKHDRGHPSSGRIPPPPPSEGPPTSGGSRQPPVIHQGQHGGTGSAPSPPSQPVIVKDGRHGRPPAPVVHE